MAAPRVSSFKVLRALSQHRRHLHITGVNSAPAVTSSEKAGSLWLSKTTDDMAAECRRRGLKAVGEKSELIERVTAHDMLQSRAYSIALKRINATKTDESVPTSRNFNTSRALKAPGDSSTMDFAFLPTNLDHTIHDSSFNMRVPILPDAYHIGSVSVNPSVAAEPAPVMKPEIYSVSGSQDIHAPSPMSEVLDNTSMDIDPFSLTETVSKAAAKMVEEGKQEAGSLKDVWSGLMDDVFGPKHKGSLA